VCKAANGKFEVVAGGRRLAALKMLAKKKALAKDAPIACHVLDGEDAAEISLAENEMRQAMHPADQFEAFKALIDAGHGIEDIAARFGVPPTVVRQRLKLAAVSPKLMALYRKAELTLDQLMAFTVSDDHAAQEAAWFDAPHWQRSAQTIRQTLTAAHVRADDRRAKFVTVGAYVGAGGSVITDLFQSKSGSYLTDPALLDRLANEKLEREAETVRQEDWKTSSAAGK
jgi:ParB family chromosome partitioning protein